MKITVKKASPARTGYSAPPPPLIHTFVGIVPVGRSLIPGDKALCGAAMRRPCHAPSLPEATCVVCATMERELGL